MLLAHGGLWARDSSALDPPGPRLASPGGSLVPRASFRGPRGVGRALRGRGDGASGDGRLADLMAGLQQVRDAGRVRGLGLLLLQGRTDLFQIAYFFPNSFLTLGNHIF